MDGFIVDGVPATAEVAVPDPPPIATSQFKLSTPIRHKHIPAPALSHGFGGDVINIFVTLQPSILSAFRFASHPTVRTICTT